MKLMIITCIIAISLLTSTSHAETVQAITETGKQTIVDNYYIPSKGQEADLSRFVDTWYNRHKNASVKTYIIYAQNYIIRTMDYDYDYKQTGWIAYTPYTVLTTKKFVCIGYAVLFKMLLDKKSIENVLVHDTVRNHMYNRILAEDIDLVKLEEEPILKQLQDKIKIILGGF